jgi:hypothetical protein
MLPRQNPSKVVKRGKADRIVSWIVLLGLGLWARLWLLGLWIFSDLLGDAFDSWVVPVIGFVLLPWTTLTYAFMWTISSDKVAGWEWLVVAIALLVDFASWAWSRAAFK